MLTNLASRGTNFDYHVTSGACLSVSLSVWCVCVRVVFVCLFVLDIFMSRNHLSFERDPVWHQNYCSRSKTVCMGV